MQASFDSAFSRQRRSRALLCSLLVSLAAGLAAPASAQTPPSPSPDDTPPHIEQEVFVTATVAPTALSSVTRSVAVITQEDVERLGLRSIIDALRLVPGVDARARGPRDVQTDFSIRGATFEQNLVLVDGLRLNNAQTGHHDGEIPLPSVAIDRVELLIGAGSAVHGADALGGTINVITRRDPHTIGSLAVGQHGLVDLQASTSGLFLPDAWTLAGWASRSDGFMFDRDFALGGAALRGSPGRGFTVDVRHQRRAFGANGFYGNSPSKEWTNQTIGSLGWQRTGSTWTTTVTTLARHHRDHFRWDINRPGFAENRHRTNAMEAGLDVRRLVRRASLALGGSTGVDQVRSSNLGRHTYTRVSAFAELQAPLTERVTAQTAVRFDDYSTFGRSVSPSASLVAAVARDLRVRASIGHAYRIPSFTELYYSDPNTLGRVDLTAERGWTLDAGADWTRRDWGGSFSVFRRWDEDVIDFVRADPAERFQATNIRDVNASGVEASLTRRWSQALLRLYYAGLSVDAPELTMQSRYVLEYARHQSGGSVTFPIGGRVRLAFNVDHRRRRDGQSYDLVAARVSRPFGRFDVFVDGSNLLNESYTEIAGVAMPGRWLSGGITVK